MECDDWTIHSVLLSLRGPYGEKEVAEIRDSLLGPLVFPWRPRNRATGQRFTAGCMVRIDFAAGPLPRLCTLSEVVQLLLLAASEHPWPLQPGLSVSRIDMASNHRTLSPPGEVCDAISQMRLPYCRVLRGVGDAGVLWDGLYHCSKRKWGQPVVATHYPLLPAALKRNPALSEAEVHYCEPRLRQEIRFRREGLRGPVGDGQMTLARVLGAFPQLVAFAMRRLKPIFSQGLLLPPGRDLEGEAALARLTSWFGTGDGSTRADGADNAALR